MALRRRTGPAPPGPGTTGPETTGPEGAGPNGAEPDGAEPGEAGMEVAKHLLPIRFCLVCHDETTDEICCTCEAPTVPRFAGR